MTVYRYIGYGTTDSNGIAKLDHNASGTAINHSYTGIGAGELDIVASRNSTITSSSIVSEPTQIFDCMISDVGTGGTGSNTNYYFLQNYVSTSPDPNNGRTVSYSGTSSAGIYFIPDGGTSDNSAQWEGEHALEFDLVNYTGGGFNITNDLGNSYNRTWASQMGLNQNTTYHIKLEIRENLQQVYIDGVALSYKTTYDFSGKYSIAIRFSAGSEITFKNLRLYKI